MPTKAKPTPLQSASALLATLSEAGARNSEADLAMIQTIHDQASLLGASCPDPTEPDQDDYARSQPRGATQEAAASASTNWVLTEKAFTQDERDALAKSGAAMSDGGYPIESKADLANAIQAFGRAKDKAATKAHIVKRAKALDATDQLPADWDGSTQKVEAEAAVELSGDVIPLSEAKAIRRDGTARVRIISPGVGTSGFYSPEVLERDAGKFADARCFWDHPKVSDNLERPERSLRDLAGKIIGTPTWEASGASGPGIYADVQVFKPYQEAVEELAGHIGMSIRALGKAKETTIGGKKMPAIEGFESVKSVDFVTQPGRGGEILQLFEAARGGQTSPPAEKGNAVDLQEAQTALAEATRLLTEAQATNAQLAERLLLREARDFADAELRGLNLPELTRTRLSEQLGRSPVIKDGKLNQDAFRTAIREAAKVELEYLTAITGQGLVRGMGSASNGAAATAQQVQDRSAKAFRDLGMSESSALAAAKGRAG